LKPLVVALDTLLAQLLRKIDNEQTFLATVAHELRTPLAVINAQATVLAKAANEQERLEAEQRMNAAIVRRAHLVHQLLVLARMETAQPADVAEVDLAMLAREEIGNLVPAALAREIEIALEAPETLIFALEVSAFQSALQNLLDNAIRYGRDGGRIGVELRRGDGVLTLAVSDDGPGIADSARAFERFYRGPAQNRPGAGLGLTIVKLATVRMGGEIRLSSREDGRGCRFEVRIPAVLGRVAEEKKRSSIALV
jgi:two-component system sensor histidine kinase QseC